MDLSHRKPNPLLSYCPEVTDWIFFFSVFFFSVQPLLFATV